jgi:hypothetical protein
LAFAPSEVTAFPVERPPEDVIERPRPQSHGGSARIERAQPSIGQNLVFFLEERGGDLLEHGEIGTRRKLRVGGDVLLGLGQLARKSSIDEEKSRADDEGYSEHKLISPFSPKLNQTNRPELCPTLLLFRSVASFL